MDMDDVSKKLTQIKNFLPNETNPKLRSFQSILPFQIICIRDALLHRLMNLGEEAVALHDRGSLIPFLLTVRACLETAALLFSLNKYMESAISTNSLDEFKEQLQKTALGSRDASTTFDSVNIMGAIKKLEKTYPGILKHYEGLSEYCHPNFAGVVRSYGDISNKKSFSFKLQTEQVKLGEAPLKIALVIALAAYDEARCNYQKILDHFFN